MTVAEGSEGRYASGVANVTLQWGRNLTVAEGTLVHEQQRETRMLQWGRNLTVAEGSLVPAVTHAANTLQWGRNLTVAEGV